MDDPADATWLPTSMGSLQWVKIIDTATGDLIYDGPPADETDPDAVRITWNASGLFHID